MRFVSFGAVTIAAASWTAMAQIAPGPAPRPVFSIGQPPRWQAYGGGLGVVETTGDGAAGSLFLGVFHSLTNPVLGVAGASGEAYGTAGHFNGGGLRALISAPIFALGTGVDWNVTSGRQGRVDWILSYRSAIRRGGLLSGGTMLRVDWLPTRGGTLGIGVNVPLRQPLAGRTRPRATAVWLPEPVTPVDAHAAPTLPADVNAALERVRESAEQIAAYTQCFAGECADRLRQGASYTAATRDYLGSLKRAFGLARGDSTLGTVVAARARDGLFDAVLVPYDSVFGQAKHHDKTIRNLTSEAQGRFDEWLRDSSAVSPGDRPAVSAVHAKWLEMIAALQRKLLAQAKDSRLVWLPLRLALAPEDYDDQQETDAVIERLVGRNFTDQNAFAYLRSADIPLEIARSIYAARDYHVVWTHDFSGVNDAGGVDNVAYDLIADAYLPALTAAVRRYDQTRKIPLYLVVLDQYWYEPNNGRMWMTMLENPLDADMRLPKGNEAREAHLRQRQRELRDAVASATRLQQDAALAGGNAWIRRIVKVNVDITQPSDFSFRSRRIIPPIPFSPDNVMRDHRKIVLYDVTEIDAYRGASILMGIGIGEHYSSASWEDRGFRLRGPAALETRAALRRLLLQNGYDLDRIPEPLREVTDSRTQERQMNLGDYVGRALQVHNEVGFGPKKASLVRAALYDLAAPGSVIITPDPLWLSTEWAGMLSAAAARGVRVQVIAPAVANAPSPQAPLMARAHDILLGMIEMGNRLAPRLRECGGELRIGIFAGHADVNDTEGRRREVRAGLQRAPWIRELVPFDAKTLAVLDRAEARSAGDGQDATDLSHDAKARLPQLHQKTQLIARPGAIAGVVRQPGWDAALARTIESQSRQTARFAEQMEYETPAVDSEALHATDAILRGYVQSLPESERTRFSFYFSVGTQNMDPRGLVSDGEATLVTSGFQGVTGLVDLYFLMARTTWITSRKELEQYVPPRGRLLRTLANILSKTL